MQQLIALSLPHPVSQSAAFLIKTGDNNRIGEMRYERTKPDERYRVFLLTPDGEIVSFGTSAIATSPHAKKCVLDYLEQQADVETKE